MLRSIKSDRNLLLTPRNPQVRWIPGSFFSLEQPPVQAQWDLPLAGDDQRSPWPPDCGADKAFSSPAVWLRFHLQLGAWPQNCPPRHGRL